MSYQLFIQQAWVIPSAADFTGISEEKLRKAFEEADKKKICCVVTVPGDIPPYKKCPICELNTRKNASVCKTESCGYIWKEADVA